jgi:hypothetical protein
MDKLFFASIPENMESVLLDLEPGQCVHVTRNVDFPPRDGRPGLSAPVLWSIDMGPYCGHGATFIPD